MTLAVSIYTGLSTTLRPYNDELRRARVGPYTTVFGGLYGTFEFFVAADPANDYQWTGGDRVVVRDGLIIVWEGVLANVQKSIRSNERGLTFSCVGAQNRLQAINVDRRWADARTTEEAWPQTTFSDKFDLNYNEGIKIIPTADFYLAWGTAIDYMQVMYTMPKSRSTGRLVKRVTFDYDFSEDATWQARKILDNSLAEKPNWIDNNPATSTTITFTAGQYIYIGSNTEFDFLSFDFGTPVNANTATLSGQYVAAQTHTWTALPGFYDYTAVGGKPWAQDGRITWTMPDDWAPDGLVGSNRQFWVRITTSATLTTNVNVKDINVGRVNAWRLALTNETGTELVTILDNAVSSVDHTLATPDDKITLLYKPVPDQPTTNFNRSIYAQVTNLIVYDDTTAPTVAKVAADLIDDATDILNSDETQIAANTYDITPFITDGLEPISSVLDRVVGFGDASSNPWYWSLLDSETAVTPDGKAVLKLAQVPALTDYEYTITIGKNNILPPFELLVDYDAIVNYVIVIYTDPDTGREVTLTPVSLSTLKDTTSITTYGERHGEPIRLGQTSAAAALNFGQRYLAQYKNPQYSVSGPIRVVGGIRTKGGGWLPASQINAEGTRVKIENYIDDVAASDGSGLTFRIAATSYNPTTDICEISTGNYDDLAVLLGRLQ